MRIFLHAGGPFGPADRAALPEFLGGLTRIAFVTAASLHDAERCVLRVRWKSHLQDHVHGRADRRAVAVLAVRLASVVHENERNPAFVCVVRQRLDDGLHLR